MKIEFLFRSLLLTLTPISYQFMCRYKHISISIYSILNVHHAKISHFFYLSLLHVCSMMFNLNIEILISLRAASKKEERKLQIEKSFWDIYWKIGQSFSKRKEREKRRMKKRWHWIIMQISCIIIFLYLWFHPWKRQKKSTTRRKW